MAHAEPPAPDSWHPLIGCTIARVSELPQAVVLATSFLKFHPGHEFAILLLDGNDEQVSLAHVNLLSLGDLGLEKGAEWRLPMLYSAKDLASILKPALLLALLKSGAAVVAFFEVATVIFDSLPDILRQAQGDKIIATEAVRSDQRDLGRSFIAVGRGAETSLRSWCDHLHEQGFATETPTGAEAKSPLEAAFDSVSAQVISCPGFAVGYWKLNPESFAWTGEHYEADGAPLRSFDFLGYDPSKPHLLSKHQGSEPRILLSEWPVIAQICHEYQGKIVQAGYDKGKRQPYRFDDLPSGLHVDHRMHSLYREADKKHKLGAEKEPPSPFGPEGEEAFLNWLNEPMGPGPKVVTRYMLAVYNEREDVKKAFPDPTGANAAGFHDWYLLFGQRELDLPVAVLPFAQSKGEEQAKTLPSGLRIDHRMLYLYREAEKMSKQGVEKEPPSPFDPAGEEDFLSWLNEPIRKATPVITRYMLAVYKEREDLRKAFPDPVGADAGSFRNWYLLFGQQELGLPAAVVPSQAPPKAEANSNTLGAISAKSVNVAGYFRAELGLGSAARSLVAALAAADIPFNTILFEGTANRQTHPFVHRQTEAGSADINIVCVNADRIATFTEQFGPELFRGRYTIGVWFWEVEDFPVWAHGAFNYVDEVWVASEFMQQTFRKVSPKAVFKFKLPVLKPEIDLSLSRADLGLPDRFVFLFSFDFFSVLERKNPLGLIEAFTRAFRPAEGPVLVIKTINGEKRIPEMEKLRYAARGRPDVILRDGYLSAVQNNSLTALADCYVSLHRSEGFGLTIAEAMALGKPAIATSYSGNLEFMTEENSYLCPAARSEVGPEHEPYPASSHWSEPDLETAAHLLRHVYTNQEEARKKGLRAAQHICKLHEPALSGSLMRDRLAKIRRRRAGTHPPSSNALLEDRLEEMEAENARLRGRA